MGIEREGDDERVNSSKGESWPGLEGGAVVFNLSSLSILNSSLRILTFSY